MKEISSESGMQCDSYLKKTVSALSTIFNENVEVRLKAANYGDKADSRIVPGEGESFN